jgi:hypothetical protein
MFMPLKRCMTHLNYIRVYYLFLRSTRVHPRIFLWSSWFSIFSFLCTNGCPLNFQAWHKHFNVRLQCKTSFTSLNLPPFHIRVTCQFSHITNIKNADMFVNGEMYSIQYYVIQFVSDLRQIDGYLRILRFPPPIKLTN